MAPALTRRAFLGGAAATAAALLMDGTHTRAYGLRTDVRSPGSRPDPSRPEGEDSLPQIEHLIILMMENHSFDNYFGMLGRGDGFTIGRGGRPTNTNPAGDGHAVAAFEMPTPCQLPDRPEQTWRASQTALAGGKMDGFVRASGPVAMGYFTDRAIPYYYALGRTFPLADRYFASCLAQTFPNRRFLQAGTALGLLTTTPPTLKDPPPPNGTIWDRLNAHGITWTNYFDGLPEIGLFPSVYLANQAHAVAMTQYFTDAAAGRLPSVSLLTVNGETSSEENPQDIQVGEAFAASVIDAAMHGPGWPKTLLVWCYDEHGGYYDHVAPPAAIPPDDVAPVLAPGDPSGRYDRYGFRVPCVVVSPFAKRDYVSHIVHDHTSILKLLETKWNLPAMTFRDANADNLLDMVDLAAPPAFLEPPPLPKPGRDTTSTNCAVVGPGTPTADGLQAPAGLGAAAPTTSTSTTSTTLTSPQTRLQPAEGNGRLEKIGVAAAATAVVGGAAVAGVA